MQTHLAVPVCVESQQMSDCVRTCVYLCCKDQASHDSTCPRRRGFRWIKTLTCLDKVKTNYSRDKNTTKGPPPLRSLYKHRAAHTCSPAPECTHTHACTRTHTCTHLHTCIHLHTPVHTYMDLNTPVVTHLNVPHTHAPAHIPVHNSCTRIHLQTHTLSQCTTQMCMHPHAHLYTHVHEHTCIYVKTSAYLHLCEIIHMYITTHNCTHLYVPHIPTCT